MNLNVKCVIKNSKQKKLYKVIIHIYVIMIKKLIVKDVKKHSNQKDVYGVILEHLLDDKKFNCEKCWKTFSQLNFLYVKVL